MSKRAVSWMMTGDYAKPAFSRGTDFSIMQRVYQYAGGDKEVRSVHSFWLIQDAEHRDALITELLFLGEDATASRPLVGDCQKLLRRYGADFDDSWHGTLGDQYYKWVSENEA